MAINLSSNPTTSGRITAASADYPYGSSKDETSPGAGDGTPYFKARADDIFGYQQWLLKKAGIVPSGTADTALVSQYGEAMLAIINELTAKDSQVCNDGVDKAVSKPFGHYEVLVAEQVNQTVWLKNRPLKKGVDNTIELDLAMDSAEASKNIKIQVEVWVEPAIPTASFNFVAGAADVDVTQEIAASNSSMVLFTHTGGNLIIPAAKVATDHLIANIAITRIAASANEHGGGVGFYAGRVI